MRDCLDIANYFYHFKCGEESYLFSGLTGAIIESDERIEGLLREPKHLKKEKELYNYLTGGGRRKRDIEAPKRAYLKKLILPVTISRELLEKRLEELLEAQAFGPYLEIILKAGAGKPEPEQLKEVLESLARFVTPRELNFFCTLSSPLFSANEELLRVMVDYELQLEISFSSRILNKGHMSLAELADYAPLKGLVEVEPASDLAAISKALKGAGIDRWRFDYRVRESFSLEEQELIKIELERLKELLLRRLSTGRALGVDNYLENLAAIHYGSRALQGCRAGERSLALDEEGRFSLCGSKRGSSEYELSEVRKLAGRRVRLLKRRSAYLKKTSCSSCWAALFCRGGCPFTPEGELEKRCFLTKEQLKGALYLYASLSEECSHYFTNIGGDYL